MLIHLSNIAFEVADDSVAIMPVHEEKLCKIELKDIILTGLKNGEESRRNSSSPTKKHRYIYSSKI